MPLSTVPAALALFHSAAHFFCRSRTAIWRAVGSFFEAVSRFLRERRAGASVSCEACATTKFDPDGAGVWARPGVSGRRRAATVTALITRKVMEAPSRRTLNPAACAAPAALVAKRREK